MSVLRSVLSLCLVVAGGVPVAGAPRGHDRPAAVAPGDLTPASLAADTSGNGVLEPGETIVLAPAWRNNAAPVPVTGALSALSGPGAPGTYTLTDASASYGTPPTGAVRSCLDAGGDCYGLSVAAVARPGLHWDATAFETLSSGSVKWWALHVGDSFADVPRASIYYRFVETLLHHRVSGGCSATDFCPGSPTTREQMAVFVLAAREGSWFAPNGCVEGATAFTDVPASSPFCPWIEELARRGVVAGCGGGNFCPAQAVSREQMAVFTLRTLEGSTYTPPACVAGSEMYGDVPAASPFCAWIEELTRRGVVAGCGGGDYCPAAPVTREQMSVFLSGTFGLALYGVEPSFFVVNTADDVVDGACTAAHCSLREAVTAANLSPNNPRRRDEVRFAIAGAGPHTLRPSSQLLLPDPVVVDGYSQPGSSPNTRPAGEAIDAVLRVEIDLSAAGAVRLEFDSLVRGLVLNRSGQAGVFLARERSAVEGCFIGTDPAGAAARPNAEGVATDLAFFARNNRVGGLSPAARNLVSGNLDTGVHLYGTLNLVRGNLIGTNRSATGPLANGGAGVYMDGGFHLGNASGNVIGGLERGATNVISGNGGAAVRFSGTCCASFGGASNNRVQANVMGRGAGGVPIPNAAGVAFDVFSASGAPVASNNLIGGLTVAPAGNLIASNTGFGVSTGSSGTAGTRIQGNAILGNGGPGVYLGEGQVTDNVIRGNAQDGVRSVPVLGPTSFTVRRNSIDGNGGLGIDVGPGGVTPNDPGDADGVLNFPVISSARSTGGVTVVTGIVPTTAAVEVDFFGSPAADPSGHGEGLVYLGSAQVSPSTTFTITLPVSLTPGWVVTATSSSGALRTSEFSQATVVTP